MNRAWLRVYAMGKLFVTMPWCQEAFSRSSGDFGMIRQAEPVSCTPKNILDKITVACNTMKQVGVRSTCTCSNQNHIKKRQGAHRPSRSRRSSIRHKRTLFDAKDRGAAKNRGGGNILMRTQLVLTTLIIAATMVTAYSITGIAEAAEGDLIWAKRAGGTEKDYGRAIAAFSDGSMVITGYFNGAATFGAGEITPPDLPGDPHDIFVAKYNADGTLAWAKSALGNDYAEGNGIAALSDGSSLVVGYFQGTVTFGSGEPNQTIFSAGSIEDIFVAKYNPDGTLAWAKRAGGGSDDKGRGIAALPDGSAVITGYFREDATFGRGEPNQTVLYSAAHYDIFVAKYNPDGTLVWAKSARGPSDSDLGTAIAALSDGGAVVLGYFSGAVTFGTGEPHQTTLTSVSTWDTFVARYNPDGTLAWAKRAGRATFPEGHENGIASLPDDSAVITGYFEGSSTFGAGEPNQTTITSAGGPDIFVAKYNSDGTLAWAKRAGGGGEDRGRDIAVLADGGALVTGCFSGIATFGLGEPIQATLSSAGGTDLFVAQYNSDGSLAWARRDAGAGADAGLGIATLSDGAALVTGYFEGNAPFGAGEPNGTTLLSAGDADIFLAKYGALPGVVEVDVDIKPGSYPNTINLGSYGLVPVAVLSSENFDATQIDPDTVTLAGAEVAVRGKGNKLMAHEEDVNGDSLLDLVMQVETENFDPNQIQDGRAWLTGATYGGVAIEGSDEICIIPLE